MNDLSPPSPSRKARQAALETLRQYLKIPVIPVPHEALSRLHDAAQQDTGGSQACRNFLFWLAGQPDPTGYRGDGGLELRRLDGTLRGAAIEVLTWWASPTRSDQPLHEILARLRERFSEQSSGDVGR